MKKAFDDSFLPPPLPNNSKSDVSTVLTPQVTVLPKHTANIPVPDEGDLLPIHKMNLAVAIISELSTVVTTMTNAYAQISVEKQRTAQVRAQADAFKTQQYEITKRTKIEQKEETKRVKIQAELEIIKLEQQWKIEENRLFLQLKELEKSEHVDEIFIKNTEAVIKNLLEHQTVLQQQLAVEISNGIYNSSLQEQFLEITTNIQKSLESLKGL